MSETPAPGGPLLAELWFESAPDLTDPTLLTRLQAAFPTAEANDESIMVPHPARTVQLEDGELPLLTAVLAASDLGTESDNGDVKDKPDPSQTWDWDGAAAALESCQGSILVTDLMASLFAPQQRVDAFRAVLQVVIDATRPSAISWPNSQQVSDPATFAAQLLEGVINVRFVTIGNDPGTVVMDTLGLHIFDLPDLQCRYRTKASGGTHEPGQVAALLFNTAAYLFAHGDVIDDGHTISGTSEDEVFRCTHQDSLVEPHRLVLDVDLGADA